MGVVINLSVIKLRKISEIAMEEYNKRDTLRGEKLMGSCGRQPAGPTLGLGFNIGEETSSRLWYRGGGSVSN